MAVVVAAAEVAGVAVVTGAGRMDPRISARRTAVIRDQGRRRLRVLAIGLACTALLVGAWFLVHTPLFSARSITVVGNVHETAAQVVAQAGLAGHPPLLDVNAGAAATRIKQLPWVRTASVHVSWPDGVHIAVTEATPRFVVGATADRWVTLSINGRVLSESTTRPPGLLLLTVPQPPGAPGTILPAKDAAGLRVASTLPASFASAGDRRHRRAGRLGAALVHHADPGQHRLGHAAHSEVRGRLVGPGRRHPAQRRCRSTSASPTQ